MYTQLLVNVLDLNVWFPRGKNKNVQKGTGGKGVSPLNPLEVILDGREGDARTVAVHLFATLSSEGTVIRDP